MARLRRPWTAGDIEKLLNMAQKYPTRQIAAKLGRPIQSVRKKAYELRVSLRMDRDLRKDVFTADHPE
jgi:uncharacterized iron-regulated protein